MGLFFDGQVEQVLAVQLFVFEFETVGLVVAARAACIHVLVHCFVSLNAQVVVLQTDFAKY